MKKIFTLALAILCCTMYALAANFDIIIKTNSEKIEALIQEVSDTEIRYKKANNPNGPMFVIKLSEISSILYANGDVQAIEHTTQPAEYNPYGYAHGNQPINGRMQRVGNDIYSIDGKTFKGKELEYFLQQSCPHAYSYYKTQKTLETTGYCFLGIGVPVCLVMGVTMMFCAYEYDLFYTGCAFVGIGGGMTLASVPMIACGNINKKRVDEVYNMQCARRTAYRPELKLTSGKSGLGFALAF